MNGAEFLVKALEAHGVTHVFGIPGAKVDSVFTALLDSPIELVLCRHEQNAAFMAQAFGRLTGRIGVCLATSGPGGNQPGHWTGHRHYRGRSRAGDRR